MDNLTRRNIRYICFRIQNEKMGGAKATKEKDGIMQFVDEVKEHMEQQDDFGEWDKFAKTWDVDEKAQLVAVTRKSSIQTQWNTILKEQAKELPVEEEKKQFLTNTLSETVQEAKKEQQAAENLPETKEKPAEIKQIKNNLQEAVQENRQQSNQPAGRARKASFWDKLK